MNIDRRTASALLCATLALPVLARAERKRTVAVLLDSLTSAFWQASLDAMHTEASRRGWDLLEAVSNADDTRQYQQVQAMIRRQVDGIIIIHTDAKAVIPAIRAANAAGVPMVHFNRAPAASEAYSVAVVADNRKIMRDTVTSLLQTARARGGHYKAAILLGDLSDSNGVERRAGFEDAVSRNSDIVEVVARIATDWNADKAFSGLTNALRAHPDINMLVSSSDFLTPQVEQALRTANKWHKAGEPGHVLIASFDGDANAYEMLAAGYYDVDGVQSLYNEVELAFGAMEQMWAGGRPAKTLIDPGGVIHRERLSEERDHMWGYSVWNAERLTRANLAQTPAASKESVSGAAGSTARSTFSLFLIGLLAFARALFSIENGRDMVLMMLPLAILVAGQMLVLIIGQIDLSMTAVMALCSIVAASVMSHYGGIAAPVPTILGIVTSVALGLGIGAFNGICTGLLRMPSFIVTLAVMMLGGGAAIWYAASVSDTISLGGLPNAFVAIGYGTIHGVPIAAGLCLVVLITVQLVLSRTRFGRWLYAVGHNIQVARIAGVPVRGVTIAAFVTSGVCAALAAIIYTARLEAGQPTLGQSMLLDIVGATVIGGVSLFGGRGSVWMVLGGVLFLSVLDKSLQLLGLSLFLVLAIKGMAILVAALLDAARQRRKDFA